MIVSFIIAVIIVVAFITVAVKYSVKIGTGKFKSSMVATTRYEYYEPEYVA